MTARVRSAWYVSIIVMCACRRQHGTPLAAVPDSFVVALETSRGRVDVMAHKDWAPNGVGRFYDLVNANHFDGAPFFRVRQGYIAQFGLSGDPKIDKEWQGRTIDDDPVKHSNTRGTISFASGGPGTRTVQLFVNLSDNPKLDALDGGFAPIALVVSGMPAIDSLYAGYGESAPKSGPQPGQEGPRQDSIALKGNAYLEQGWPKLDFVKTARVTQQWPQAGAPSRP
jgi:peptidyl-prolyl cis-trans isomerase A (cyclophilin A)